MFNFSKTQSAEKLNKDYILKRVTDAQIFGYYFGPFTMNECYPSKFRKDKHPSTGFYIGKSGKLIYNDLARSNEKYDCFAFVAKLYTLPNFDAVVRKIANDFGLIKGAKPTKAAEKAIRELKDFDKKFKKETRIIFKPAKLDGDNMRFWHEYHISDKEFKSDLNFVIKDLWINDRHIPNIQGEQRYALCEMVKGEMLTKVYTPGNSNFKWITNIPTEHPFGINDLKYKSDQIFITKSEKCKLVIKKFISDVIALQSEQFAALEKVDKNLKFNYKKLYLGCDNDKTGLDFMDEMGQQGYIPAFLPVEFREQRKIKDLSDLSKADGIKAVEQFLKSKNII